MNGLNYDFAIPYAGGATLSLQNNGTAPLSIQSFSFVSNNNIGGDPWGALFPYGSTITQSVNPDNLTYTYTVALAGGLTIDAGASLQLQYNAPGALGPLNIPMDPASVSVTSAAGTELLTIAGACPTCESPTGKYSNVVYYSSWDMYGREYPAKNLPIDKINRINYSFIGFDALGNIKSLDSNADSQQLPVIGMMLKQYPYLDATLSFGGWGQGAIFSAMAADPSAMENFIKKAGEAVDSLKYTGINIDWEYPNATPQDPIHFTNLMLGLRAYFDAKAAKIFAETGESIQYKLSIAAPAGDDKIAALNVPYPGSSQTCWEIIAKTIDYAEIMTYDYYVAEVGQPFADQSPVFWDPANPYPADKLYTVNSTMALYGSVGFSPEQLMLGLPLYARTAVVSSSVNNGHYQTVSSISDGQFPGNNGNYDYRCLVAGECGTGTAPPSDLAISYPSNDTMTPWGYSKSTLTAATFDTVKSSKFKTETYGVTNGGVMYWDASGDVSSNSSLSIIAAVQTILAAAAGKSSAINEGRFTTPNYQGSLDGSLALLAVLAKGVSSWFRGKSVESKLAESQDKLYQLSQVHFLMAKTMGRHQQANDLHALAVELSANYQYLRGLQHKKAVDAVSADQLQINVDVLVARTQKVQALWEKGSSMHEHEHSASAVLSSLPFYHKSSEPALVVGQELSAIAA
ncbi:MAG: glycoside hydrolase family 18 protein [Gammaproteobacteria bacterium]|nr:glycoside hydrolase family 18 protein [Gammaproteobacteria bacterium]